MKQRIKKPISAGVIKSEDLIRATKPRQEITFRTGAHQTAKDRPRRKMKPKDYRREDW